MNMARLLDFTLDTADLSEPRQDDAWEIADQIDRRLRIIESTIDEQLPPSEADLTELLLIIDR